MVMELEKGECVSMVKEVEQTVENDEVPFEKDEA
jgi:hypothetical protein